MTKHMPALAVLAAAVLGGYLASRAGLPLAWLLGALVPTAIGSILGVAVFASRRGRKLGQLLVGTAIGLYLTAEAAGLIVSWLPVMIITAFVSIVATALFCVPYSRAARVDLPTAFFAITPGGLAEMGRVGEKEGAHRESVAMSQAVRVALLVCVLPPLLLTFGVDGGLPDFGLRPLLSPVQVAFVLAAGGLCILVLRHTPINNPWMIGALLGAGSMAAFGLIEGRMPQPLLGLGQFLIGITIGARFRRESLARLPRVCAMSALFIALMAIVMFGYALLLHRATGMDLSSATLAAAPGGLAEMALTAQSLHLGVALVTTFHVVRSFIVNGFNQYIFRLFRRSGLFSALERMMSRVVGPSE